MAGDDVSGCSDEALMQQLQDGQKSAFDELYARWHEPVHAFLLRSRLDAGAADDALQETFVRVYEQAWRYDASRPFRPWLYTLAWRFGVNQRRVLRHLAPPMRRETPRVPRTGRCAPCPPPVPAPRRSPRR